MKLTKSQEYLKRAKEVLPCQTQTLSKGWTQFVQGVCPVYLQKGNGSHVWDVDGNEFIDYITALGPVILGYNDEDVNKAITEQLKDGITFSLPHPLEVELAEDLKKLIPCAEMVRYGKNGSDATSAAVRIARAVTGREKIACCGYHGWPDWYITTTTRKRGVPKAMDSLICTFEYNKIETLRKLFADNPGTIAAVIMEPIGVEDPQPGFLDQVRDIAHQNGALLIFDEVVTGFRVALGGAQSHYKVIPDLAAFGKALSNGMPLSFVAGKKDIMQKAEDCFISMTSGGEALSLAAARATIKKLQDKNVIPHLWAMGQRLKDAIIAGIKANDLPIEVKGLPVHFVCVFKDASGQESLEFKSLFIQEMVKRGILTGGYFNQCFAHSAEDIEKTIKAANETFAIMKTALSGGNIKKFLEGPAVQPVFRKL
jgi:glutamate-1-semialdehyde aminotransferase